MRKFPLLFLAMSVGASAADLQWITMQETQEHSFSVDVPKGWNTTGGLYWFSPQEPRMWVDMRSPDGKVDIRLGDHDVPKVYQIPNWVFDRAGVHEGMWTFSGGVRNKLMLLHYQPGQIFANMYGQVRFAQNCQTLEPKQMNVRQPLFKAPIPSSREDAGDVIYRCVSNGQEMVAYAVAETEYIPVPGFGYTPAQDFWLLIGLSSFMSPKDQGIDTWKAMWHSISTFRINPEWWSRFTRAFTAAAQRNAQTTQAAIKQSNAEFEQRQAQMAKQTDDFNRILTNSTLRVDPATGNQLEVPTGQWKTYWISGAGQTVSSALSPGSAFHELKEPQ
jgi:hypothetical protein